MLFVHPSPTSSLLTEMLRPGLVMESVPSQPVLCHIGQTLPEKQFVKIVHFGQELYLATLRSLNSLCGSKFSVNLFFVAGGL